MILSKCRFIPHNFHRDAWWNLWSSGSYGSLDSQNKMALPSMYRRRWRHIHAFIGKNTIALRVQRFAAGANIICLTYATDWWAAIDPVSHGESKSQATRSSSDHVGLLCTLSTRQHSTQSVGNMPPPSPPHLLPQVLQTMPRNPKYDQFQPKGHHNEENPQSTTKMPGNPKFYPFH